MSKLVFHNTYVNIWILVLLKFPAAIQDVRFIQHTKTSTASKKLTRATIERSFIKFVFSDFLNIRKNYYKSQQYPLNPHTEMLKWYSYFWGACIISMKTFFKEYFPEHGGFLEILKQVFRVNFPEFSLPTCFLLKISY